MGRQNLSANLRDCMNEGNMGMSSLKQQYEKIFGVHTYTSKSLHDKSVA